MSFREGDHINFDQVVMPLIQRGYLTWDDVGVGGADPAGFQAQQYDGKTTTVYGGDKLVAAVKRFQHDHGIHGADGHAHGIIGNRTLNALGQQTSTLEVETLIARNLREHAAQVSIDNNPDANAAAHRIAGIRRAYPTMGPKVTAALGLTGYGADDDITKELARRAMTSGAKPFWQTIPTEGDTTKNEGNNGNLVDTWAAAIQGRKPAAHPDQPGAPDHGDQGGGIVDDIYSGVKGVARGAFTALETPFQALTGAERNAVRGVAAGASALHTGNLELGPNAGPAPAPTQYDIGGVKALAQGGEGVGPFDQSSGGLALQKIAAGQRVDLGTGFFPAGQIEEQQAENARRALSIGGHAATVGRLAAAVVTQPGTEPYEALSGLVDMANIVKTDPANLIIGATSDIRAARATLTATPEVADEATGLVNGIRRTILPQSAERWLTQSRAGTKVVERLAVPESKGGPTFLQTLKAVGGDTDLAVAVHNAESPSEVMNALRPKLGITLTDKPSLPFKVTQPLRDVTDGWRMLNTVPEHLGDLKNMNATVKNFDRWLVNGKVSLERRNELTKALAVADGRESQYQALKDGAHAVEDSLVEHGVHPNQAKGLTKMFQTWDDFRHYMIDEAGQDVSPFYTVDGKAVLGKTPAYFIDFLNRAVPFPNVRKIREATDTLSHVRNAPGVIGQAGDAATFARHEAQYFGDKFNNVWKPLVLARVGFPLRVIAESQAAMAMAGHESMFSHPIHFITQLVTSPKTDINGKSFIKMAEDAAHTGDYDPYVDAMAGWSRQFISNSDEYGRRLKGFQVLDAETDPEQFARAWHERLARLSTDPIAKNVAAVKTPADLAALKERFWSGDLKPVRLEMIAGPEDATFSLTSASGAGQYIDNIENDVRVLTNSDPELRRALAEREATIDGKKVKPFHVSKGGKVKLDSVFARHLQDRVATGDTPAKVIGQLTIDSAKDTTGRWDKATTFMFDHLVTQPTNKLTYSPLFRESYYRHIGELAAHMSPADREKAAVALEANLVRHAPGSRAVRAVTGHLGNTISDDIRRIGGEGLGLSYKEADKLAKIQALDTVKGTIHDLAHRGQAFDIFRNIAPFGEAWKQVLTRWAKITYHHPETLRKFQVAIEGARGAGFFYTDPATGQELFNYPGSAGATKALFGVPVPLAGAVESLNIAGNGLPGVGPVVQMSVGAIVPNTPDTDWVRRFVSPFGDQADPSGNPFKTLVNYTVPSWMGKAITAISGKADSDVGFAHSVMAMQRYLMTTGEYGDSVTEQRRLVDDATNKAKAFYAVRAFASLTGPAAPIPQAGVLDKDGNFMYQLALSDEYRKLQDEGQRQGKAYDQIDAEFLAKYGEKIYGAMQPYTRALVQSLPVTKSQEDWARSNSDAVSKFPNVYGFFTPPSKPGEKFDQVAYQRQVANGERQKISPRTWRRLANDRIASHLYYAARDQVGPSPDKADASLLSQYHDFLLSKYPGFESDQGLMGKASPDEVVQELSKAIKDPKLRKTRQAKTIGQILDARDAITSVAAEAGIHTVQGWQTSDRMLPLREKLATFYDLLRKEDPSASRVIDSVFANDTRGT